MNKLNRTLAFLLTLLTLLPAAASCGSTAPADPGVPAASAQTDAEDAAPAETAPGETDRSEAFDEVGEIDFGGASLRILCRSDDELYLQEFVAEEQNGEIINDAVYARNLYTMEKLNAALDVSSRPGSWGSHNEFVKAVANAILAGDDAWEIVSCYAYAAPMLVQQGVFANLYDLPHLDVKQPWWHGRYVDAASVGGRLYTIDGELSLTSTTYRSAMFFNKTLCDAWCPNDYYGVVLDGKWTVEYFRSVVKDLYQDVNGDSVRDVGDLYGYVAYDYDAWTAGQDVRFTARTVDGGYEYCLDSEHNINAMEAMAEMIENDAGTWYDDQDNEKFAVGTVIFASHKLSFAQTKLRDFGDEFGILPSPKYDEAQDAYYSISNDNYSTIAVPLTCAARDLAGAALEVMCAASYRGVTPAYFEVAMKEKYLRDSQSAQMFDIILDGAWYDFAMINTSVLGDPVFLTRRSCQHQNGKTFVSQWAADGDKLTAALASLVDVYASFE